MNNFWNKTNMFLSIIAIIVTILVTWFFNREKITALNIEQVNATMLSRNPDIDGLTVQYLYHDTIQVKNLWKTIFTIKNVGDQSLYGKGFSDTNVRDGIIPLMVGNSKRVLSIKLTSNNCGCQLLNNNSLIVTQWKPNEYAEVEILTEGEKSPTLRIEPRNIKDASISYSQYTPATISATPKLIDKIPASIRGTLKWIIVFVMGIMILAAIFQMPQQLKDKSNGIKVFTIILWCIFLTFILSPLLWMF